MYAIVKVGGKQYRVEKGDSLLVDRMREDEGAKVALEPLLFADGDKSVSDGTDLGKVKVDAVVSGHERGKKLRVFKYKPKKGYRRTRGHRSELTRLEIKEIRLAARKPAAAKAAAKGEGKAAAKGEGKAAAKGEGKAAAKGEAKAAAKGEGKAGKPAARKPAAKKATKPKETKDGS